MKAKHSFTPVSNHRTGKGRQEDLESLLVTNLAPGSVKDSLARYRVQSDRKGHLIFSSSFQVCTGSCKQAHVCITTRTHVHTHAHTHTHAHAYCCFTLYIIQSSVTKSHVTLLHSTQDTNNSSVHYSHTMYSTYPLLT